MQRLDHRSAAILAAIAAAVALTVVHGSERLLGFVPCGLCLLERWPWRATLVLGILAALIPPRPAGRLVLALILLVLLASLALGVLHVGVEQHFWPSPLPECNPPVLHGNTFSQILASMPARPSKPCDAPSYLIPGLPLSMAAMNLLYSLVILALLATYLMNSRRQAR
ncbi:MAG: disulfide bond formation protein B [Acetobacteraceae bacterium]